MSKQREALQVALEALDQHGTSYLNHEDAYSVAITAIREALAEPTRKPLTDEDISAIVQSMWAYTWDAHMFARLIEKAHGITE